MSFHSRLSFSVSFFHVSLGLPVARLPSSCISYAVITAQLESSTCPNQRSHLSINMRSRSSSSSFARSSLDLIMATFSVLILQVCLIMARVTALQALQVCLGQWPSFTDMEHDATHGRAVYMATGLVGGVVGCGNW